MLDKIRAFLEENPGSKARTIAAQLEFERPAVSRILHDHSDKFQQNTDFDWFVNYEACHVEFTGSGWLTPWDFEKALLKSSLRREHKSVVFILKDDCKALLEVLSRLLAICNQLVAAGKAVTLDLDGSRKTLTYLDRVGFFGLLDAAATVLPERPSGDLARTYQGNNDGVIEFRSIDPEEPNQDIPDLLLHSFVACAGDSYSQTAFTVLAELFGNVTEHSRSSSPGFACLQFYKKAKKIQAVISDNGLGIIGTLQPVLAGRYPKTAGRIATAPHAGVALLKEVFSRGGLSQVDEEGRGLGLRVSAKAAGKFRARISVRQSDFEFGIHHDLDGVRFSERVGLAHLAGTHICFEFKLDAAVQSP